MKPRVVLVTNALTPYRIPLFNRLAQSRKYEFLVLLLAKQEANREWKLDLKRVEFDYEIVPGVHYFIRRWDAPMHFSWGLVSWLWLHRPDVVITPETLTYSGVLLYRWAFRKSHIVWAGTTKASAPRDVGVWLRRRLIRGAVACVAYGTKSAEWLESMGANKRAIHVGVNTVDVEFFSRATEQYRNDPNFAKKRSSYPPMLLIFVGRLERRKGLSVLLDALRLLGDPEIGLLVVGNGSNARELRQAAEGIPGVEFVGYKQQDELVQYLALADVFVFPSLQEPWGLVVNEALASGLYVLASDRAGASADLIQPGWNGELFNPGCVEELVEKLLHVKGRLGEIRSRRTAIQAAAKRDLAIERYAQAFEVAIADALARM